MLWTLKGEAAGSASLLWVLVIQLLLVSELP